MSGSRKPLLTTADAHHLLLQVICHLELIRPLRGSRFELFFQPCRSFTLFANACHPKVILPIFEAFRPGRTALETPPAKKKRENRDERGRQWEERLELGGEQESRSSFFCFQACLASHLFSRSVKIVFWPLSHVKVAFPP